VALFDFIHTVTSFCTSISSLRPYLSNLALLHCAERSSAQQSISYHPTTGFVATSTVTTASTRLEAESEHLNSSENAYTANMEHMRIGQLISTGVIEAIAKSHGPQIVQHTRAPSTSGWWRCCGCGREVNPDLNNDDCPDCGHHKCDECAE